MQRYCLTLDLQDDPYLVEQYIRYYQDVWSEILESIRSSGITGMQIYHYDGRLMMIMETNDDFSFERKAAMDAANETVQEWEELMWKFQKPLPGAKPGEKWMRMEKIFELD